MKKRIYVEKKPGYQIEAQSLLENINNDLNLKINSLRLINVYDIYNIEEKLLKKSIYTVFGEIVTDIVTEKINFTKTFFGVEPLTGSFDQKADSAQQCLKIISPSTKAVVKTSKLIMMDELTEDQLKLVKNFIINKVESKEFLFNETTSNEITKITPVMTYKGFIKYSENELINFKNKLSLAMNDEDIIHIQKYFTNIEKRDPSETEILMLDTYWSDHCRHTTFETVLKEVKFEKGNFNKLFENAFFEYIELRKELYKKDKPITLMDMATINSRYERKNGNLDDLEISDEINACSVYIDVDVNGKKEKWLLMFKNETHNHPTEIEPFGGASTCVGGAIRDPLSGRSYVYQAMRISGSCNPLESVDNTLSGKLSQRKISKESASGYSSYGNQIGVATTFVKELYHDGYKAKHMEVGAVVGAVKASNIKREKPNPGDVVVMLGGRTGKDGIGGATGSSKEQTEKSIINASAEVQKGNAPEERKIQRLFRNPKASIMIKKSNDFGAGGISVAIGEMADSIDINLDAVKTKYDGMNGTEIAISESQERMAVLINKIDEMKFIDLCHHENIEAVTVATVTDSKRLTMTYKNQKIVDLSREFIETNGVRQEQNVSVGMPKGMNPVSRKISGKNIREKILNNLKDMNIASQKGMVENFDSTVGASTILMPYGGKNQLTKSQVSAQTIPVLNSDTDTASVMTYGYDPFVSKWSPFHGASYAIIESISKLVSAGTSLKKIRFTFQEYFEKLGINSKKWGKPVASLLGAIKTLKDFEFAAIGGKDSMSGSYREIDVPPTLISFAITTESASKIISSEFKSKDNYIYIVKHELDEHDMPNIDMLKNNYLNIYNEIQNRIIVSSRAVVIGGISQALIEMSLGNNIGFNIETKLDLFRSDYGSIIIESKEELNFNNFILLGKTATEVSINNEKFEFKELEDAWTSVFNKLDAIRIDKQKSDLKTHTFVAKRKLLKKDKKQVNVFLPIFPGTNSEYDMCHAFQNEGANVKQIVFKNKSESDIKYSIKKFVEEINKTDIIAISGGFSAGDEPDGSGKFIANILQNNFIKDSINKFLKRDGLILGICNGFQALIKSGLLPDGVIGNINEDSPTLFKNDINRHVSHITTTRVCINDSPWLNSFEIGETHSVPVSHGEGKFMVSDKKAKELFKNNQVAFQYATDKGVPTMNGNFNPNGSSFAIEGIVSKCGNILGKMAHSERKGKNLYKNIHGNKEQNIFKNVIKYLKGES